MIPPAFQHSMEALMARAKRDIAEIVKRLTKDDFVDSYLIEHKNGQKLWWDVYRATMLGKPCFLSLRSTRTNKYVVGPIRPSLEEVQNDLRNAVEPVEIEP